MGGFGPRRVACSDAHVRLSTHTPPHVVTNASVNTCQHIVNTLSLIHTDKKTMKSQQQHNILTRPIPQSMTRSPLQESPLKTDTHQQVGTKKQSAGIKPCIVAPGLTALLPHIRT